MRIKVLFALLLILLTLRALAAEASPDCESIEDPNERVKCHAVAFASTPWQPGSPAEAETGVWKMRSAPDPQGGEIVYFASLRAEHGRDRWSGPAWLTVRCKADRTELYMTWGENLDTQVRTIYALDTGVPVKENWTRAPDRTAAFYPSSPINFLKRLIKANSLVITVTPADGSPHTAVFVTSGAQAALAPVRKACGW